MILFDWDAIIRDTGGDVDGILAIMQHLTWGDYPTYKIDPLYRYVRNLSLYRKGTSFLVNPYDLIRDTELGKLPPKSVAEYIGAAAYRDIQNLLLYRRVDLPLETFPLEVNLNENPLVSIKDGFVHFAYESKA